MAGEVTDIDRNWLRGGAMLTSPHVRSGRLRLRAHAPESLLDAVGEVPVSRGLALLSHGLESGPTASKVTALAAVAEAAGWKTARPDYLEFDRGRDEAAVADRIAHLLAQVTPGTRLVLAGSSLGAFISARASLEVPVAGLFLIAPPPFIHWYSRPLEAADVPTTIVHGWHDELIPPAPVLDFARARSARLHLVNDSHRLSDHVEQCAEWFGQFLREIPQ